MAMRMTMAQTVQKAPNSMNINDSKSAMKLKVIKNPKVFNDLVTMFFTYVITSIYYHEQP